MIGAGGYKLADMHHKIKKLYAMGDLTEEETDELLSLASAGASPEAERPEVLRMVSSLSEKITALENRVRVLEDSEQAEDSAWYPWDGISDLYQPGAVVTHRGKHWISTFRGQNVWEPGTVDDSFWAEYVPGQSASEQ